MPVPDSVLLIRERCSGVGCVEGVGEGEAVWSGLFPQSIAHVFGESVEETGSLWVEDIGSRAALKVTDDISVSACHGNDTGGGRGLGGKEDATRPSVPEGAVVGGDGVVVGGDVDIHAGRGELYLWVYLEIAGGLGLRSEGEVKRPCLQGYSLKGRHLFVTEDTNHEPKPLLVQPLRLKNYFDRKRCHHRIRCNGDNLR